METIKSIRMVYQIPCFFGGTKQGEDTTYNPSRKNIKKAFAYLKANPLNTAMWVDFGEYSWGMWFESEENARFGCVTVKSSNNYRPEVDTRFMSFDTVKREVYGCIK